MAFFADRVEGNLLAAHQEISKLALLYPLGELSAEQVESAVHDVLEDAVVHTHLEPREDPRSYGDARGGFAVGERHG